MCGQHVSSCTTIPYTGPSSLVNGGLMNVEYIEDLEGHQKQWTPNFHPNFKCAKNRKIDWSGLQ
jgi:hypothetical protein